MSSIESTRVAPERSVVDLPDGRRVIVAAGDPWPAGAAYVENTPNKVDAAANHDVADAADQAVNAMPSGPIPVRRLFGQDGPTEAELQAQAALERTAANRADLDERNRRELGAGATLEGGETALADMTHAQLDELADADAVADYPRSGNKDEKVAAIEAHRAAPPADGGGE